MTLAELEREFIERVLDDEAGNKTRAAQRLELDHKTLYRKFDEYARMAGTRPVRPSAPDEQRSSHTTADCGRRAAGTSPPRSGARSSRTTRSSDQPPSTISISRIWSVPGLKHACEKNWWLCASWRISVLQQSAVQRNAPTTNSPNSSALAFLT